KGLDTDGMNVGGGYSFDFGHVKYIQAYHRSAFIDDNGNVVYIGMVPGVILTINDKAINHLGDRALCSYSKMDGTTYDVDLAFVTSGDNFKMGPDDALLGSEWIQAKKVVLVHYNTFPVIEQDPDKFAAAVKPGKGVPLKVGESIEL